MILSLNYHHEFFFLNNINNWLKIFDKNKRMLTFVALSFEQPAGVAKLVDASDLGSDAARCGGSSPFTRTFLEGCTFFKRYSFFYLVEKLLKFVEGN